MPASAPQAITEVAKPVMVRAEIRAQSSVGAVMMIRVPTMGKASANVSTMVTPLTFSLDMGCPAFFRSAPSRRTIKQVLQMAQARRTINQ